MMTGSQKERGIGTILCVGVLLCSVVLSLADVRGVITTTDGRRLSGSIRWMPASKLYSLTQGEIAMQLPVSQVARVDVEKPAGLDTAVDLVRARKYSQAVDPLQSIADDYSMLQWDAVAARWLAEAHMGLQKPDKAVMVCQKVTGQRPEAAVSGDLAPVYWEALLQAGQEAILKRLLDDAVRQGDRAVAAQAQNKRGDIEKKNGRFKEALVDGYLRTIVLFDQDKAALPDALYKAMQCFQELGQMTHAEKMRKRLLDEFSDSPQARMAQSGR